MKSPKPHYIYIERRPDGARVLTIMSVMQEVQKLELTFDSAMKFAHDFTVAAMDLHKSEVTRLGNKEHQVDLFTPGDKDAVQSSSERPSDNPPAGDIPPVPSL